MKMHIRALLPLLGAGAAGAALAATSTTPTIMTSPSKSALANYLTLGLSEEHTDNVTRVVSGEQSQTIAEATVSQSVRRPDSVRGGNVGFREHPSDLAHRKSAACSDRIQEGCVSHGAPRSSLSFSRTTSATGSIRPPSWVWAYSESSYCRFLAA